MVSGHIYNDFFEYKKRIGIGYWQDYNSEGIELLYSGVYVAWDTELVNDDGAHYHVWIDRSLSDDKIKEEVYLDLCESACRALGDVVVFTYAYIPTEE